MKLKYVFSSLGILICLSVFADGVKPAKVGEQSPDFQFADKNGTLHLLASQQTWTKTNGLNLLKRKL